ncbi:hypothetical protein, partial [Staphylococcus delphini]|uniref:hypothetical protein n=1 Tax=Staphylococcus delphini TaxID=53344 RepID=UPI000584D2C1
IDKKIDIYDLYESEIISVNITEDYSVENTIRIELSEDEIPFLDLEDEILNKNNKKSVMFILSGSLDNLPNNY